MKKTLLALVLAVAMLLVSMPVVFAEAPTEITLWHYFDSSNDK